MGFLTRAFVCILFSALFTTSFAADKCSEVLATLENIGPTKFADMVRVEIATWNIDQAASTTTILNRIIMNSRSTYVLYDDLSKKPIGSAVVLPIETFDEQSVQPWNSYAELAESPLHFHNLRKPRVWYVVSLTATPDAPRGTGTALFQKLKTFAKANHIETIYGGVRIDGFRRHHLEHGTTIEEYLGLLKSHKVSERAYGAAVRSGAVPKAILRDFYLDPPSMNYAILMAHQIH
jgi:hypothetical protein